jgi:hypothetical protein
MTKNLGTVDRALRLMGAVGAALCAAVAPLPLPLRLGVFAGTAIALLVSALAGSCPVYRLLGKSTCSLERRA